MLPLDQVLAGADSASIQELEAQIHARDEQVVALRAEMKQITVALDKKHGARPVPDGPSVTLAVGNIAKVG